MIAAAIIINASAGTGCASEWTEQLVEKFRSVGWDVRVTLAQNGAEIIDAAQRAVTEGISTVIAGGGDGTLNAVASVLVGTDVAFGILPMGTLNHFAKDLQIPLTLDDAIAAIVTGHCIKVDAGEVNGRIFINNSSIGIYPDIVREREKQQRRLGRGKWLAFVWATLTALRRYPFLTVQLNVNNQLHDRHTPFVFIGNNKYTMEGFNIGARACLNAGQLSLYVAQRTGRWGLLRLALDALCGRLRQAKDFDALTANAVVIATRHKRLRVATDGEVTVMETPLRYLIRPGALQVIVPEQAATLVPVA